MTNPAAWHPDPTSAHEYRWWDGTRWTEHVADGGQASVDPLPGAGDPGATSGDATQVETGADETGTSAYGASAASTGEESSAGTDSWQQPGSSDPAATVEQPAHDQQRSWQQPADQGTGGAGGQPPSWQQTPAWSQPGGQDPATTGTNGIAIAAMVIGIIAILISWIPILGALAGVLALVLGFVGRSKFNKTPAVGGSGPAITGIVTGIVATLISLAITIALFAFGSTFMGTLETYEECLERGGSPEECQEELERDFMDRFGQ